MDNPTPLLQLSDAAWLQAVNRALRHYQSLLTLARSPLASSPLIDPALVLDDLSPSADERGRAVRLLLQWAVATLAPEPPAHLPGQHRPLDDLTWRDPRWWGYNILRHRYLEPLHPDDFVADGRFTDTLISLTGIPGRDAYFAERNRAIRDVAGQLQEQARTGAATPAIRQLALASTLQLLADRPAAGAVLQIAALFDGVFPRRWLLSLLAAERLPDGAAALAYLQQHQFLQAGSGGEELWLAGRRGAALREHVYAQVPPGIRRRRHAAAAALCAADGDTLQAVGHWQAAAMPEQAASQLLAHAPALITDLQHDGLIAAAARFRRRDVSDDAWRDLQTLLADLYYQTGELALARAACRRALTAATAPADTGRLYRRLGKLYEGHNQTQALGYYRQAAAALEEGHPEYIDLLKDRGWLLILRQDWDAAADDLRRALALEPEPAQRADVLDALAVLHSRRGEPETAVELGLRALARREQLGDAARVARSLHNLALAYDALGRYPDAIAAYQEALRFFRRTGDRTAQATILLSLGASYHFDGQLAAAIDHYRDCLACCRAAGVPLVEVKAQGNLAEALAELGDGAAIRHWELGYQLAQAHGFADQLAYFDGLMEQFPLLQAAERPAMGERSAGRDAPPAGLDPVAERALALARDGGSVTAGRLAEAASVSKATATRRLAELVDQGRLLRRGERRGTHYLLPEPAPPAGADWAARLPALWPALQVGYGVTALAVAAAPPGGPPRLIVAFETAPALADFFGLEAYLVEALGVEVDLLPQDSVRAAGVTAVRHLPER